MKHRSARLAAPALLILAAAAPLAGQDAPAWSPGWSDRWLQTASPLVNEKGVLEAVFEHRFNEPVNKAGGNDLFGLDGSANIGLGVGYVPVDRLSVEVFRASTGGDYEFAAKYAVLTPTKDRPFGVAVRGGLDWLTKYQIEQKVGGFGQVLLAAMLWDRLTIAVAPTFVSNTPLYRNVFNVPIAVQVRIWKGLYATGEYVPRNKDLEGAVGQWSFALEKTLWLHRFAVWIGNSPATTVDQMMASDYGGGIRNYNIRLGFNIVRQFEIAVK
ncbi:MAG TPA: DUF5777 family beta-barrel protein [Thermoanaerobaculia bacterium]|nr:DUF5777 family beta-barrel protein [Thermoanaerobaculia bacterium]HQR67472.1 DUF5777 family beta-barrel protein [Thermoanaerobaculia bacterium]